MIGSLNVNPPLPGYVGHINRRNLEFIFDDDTSDDEDYDLSEFDRQLQSKSDLYILELESMRRRWTTRFNKYLQIFLIKKYHHFEVCAS